MLRVFFLLDLIYFLSVDIPDVESMNSPLCNNFVKALVLQGQRSREKFAVGWIGPSPSSSSSTNFLLLSDNLLPNPHPLPAHLSSPFIPTGQ